MSGARASCLELGPAQEQAGRVESSGYGLIREPSKKRMIGYFDDPLIPVST